MASWSLLTKHARVLLCIARNPNVRLRDIAAMLEITERSAYSIVGDLADQGYLLKEKEGRRNHYVVQRNLTLPEPTIEDRTVGEVLDVFLQTSVRPRRTA
jgi:predicted transcriptional regulator